MNSNWKVDGLPYLISDNQITVSLPDGRPKSVLKADTKVFNLVLEAIRAKKWEDIPNLVDVKKAIESKFSQFVVNNDTVYVNGEAVPNSLSKKIVEFSRQNLPVEPLLRFWDNLNKNPSFHSVNQLHEFLDKNNHPITPDGCFIAYRRITDDFKDFYSGKMDNSIGTTVSMSRNKVNENPNQTCSYGLHVANYDYACNHYNSGSGKLVIVKVNPEHVVAVPTDYDQAKMRVCEFVVLEEIEAELPQDTVLYGECSSNQDSYNEDSYDDEDEDEEDDYESDDNRYYYDEDDCY